MRDPKYLKRKIGFVETKEKEKMSQELQLGKYEFYPYDRLQQLIEELLSELKQLRRSRRLLDEDSDEELERGYREMAE